MGEIIYVHDKLTIVSSLPRLVFQRNIFFNL